MGTPIGWVDPDAVTEGMWPDVVQLDPGDRDSYLLAAYEQCLEYAPDLEDGAPVPERYRHAQISQARDLFMASISGDGETLGTADSGFTIRVKPLSTGVKSLLRPRRGLPLVG